MCESQNFRSPMGRQGKGLGARDAPTPSMAAIDLLATKILSNRTNPPTLAIEGAGAKIRAIDRPQ